MFFLVLLPVVKGFSRLFREHDSHEDSVSVLNLRVVRNNYCGFLHVTTFIFFVRSCVDFKLNRLFQVNIGHVKFFILNNEILGLHTVDLVITGKGGIDTSRKSLNSMLEESLLKL